MLRPRVDLDALARTYDAAIARLTATGARVVMFTIFDPGGGGIYGPVRGRMAIFNEWVREIADRHGVTVVDMWRMRDVEISGAMDTDRMHLNAFGHTYIAHSVLEAIGVEHGLEPVDDRAAAGAGTPRDVGGERPVDARVPRAVGAPPDHRPLLGRHRLRQAPGPVRGPVAQVRYRSARRPRTALRM